MASAISLDLFFGKTLLSKDCRVSYLSLGIVYFILNKQLRIVSSLLKILAKEIVLSENHCRRRVFSGKDPLSVPVVLLSATIAPIKISHFVDGAEQQTNIHDMESLVHEHQSPPASL